MAKKQDATAKLAQEILDNGHANVGGMRKDGSDGNARVIELTEDMRVILELLVDDRK